MKTDKIPYATTGFFSKIVTDYLNGDNSLRSFYSYLPDISSFQQAIEDKAKEKIDRNNLFNILEEQYNGLHIENAVRENIDAFKNQNTYCIVTAHQLNIFTGPLYCIYKIISAISACRELAETYKDYRFVPVFWLGSEDHDFEEINHFDVFGKTFSWEDKQGGACGNYDPHSMSTLLETLKPVLGESENAKNIFQLFSSAYLDHTTLAASARYYLNALFGKYGLVVVDGDNIEMKKTCSEIIIDELQNASSSRIVSETLDVFPGEAQAKPREINLFYLADHFRERIIWDHEKQQFHIHNSELNFSKENLIADAEKYPEHFSPNVILRPLFQQKVLPSLAYIGGGSEVAYWLQLKSLFEHYGINFPVLLLRNSVLWVDENAQKKMQKTGLKTEDLFKDKDRLVNEVVKAMAGDDINLAKEKEISAGLFDSLLERAKSVDPTLDKMILAEKQNALNSMEKIESKMLKAMKLRSENTVGQITALKEKLFPGGSLQERHDNFIPLYIQQGPGLFEKLLQNLTPFDRNFIVLSDSELS